MHRETARRRTKKGRKKRRKKRSKKKKEDLRGRKQGKQARPFAGMVVTIA